MVAQTTTFKGHPILVLEDENNNRNRLQFGILKAELIAKHIKDIEKFIVEGKELEKMNKSWDDFKG